MKTLCLNGELKVGDTVVSIPTEEYGGLIGIVTKIKPLGSPNRDTENDTDDIYVDFENDYSPNRRKEILGNLQKLYDDPQKTWESCTLDSVIMAPSMLLKIDLSAIRETYYRKMLDTATTVDEWCIFALKRTAAEYLRLRKTAMKMQKKIEEMLKNAEKHGGTQSVY